MHKTLILWNGTGKWFSFNSNRGLDEHVCVCMCVLLYKNTIISKGNGLLSTSSWIPHLIFFLLPSREHKCSHTRVWEVCVTVMWTQGVKWQCLRLPLANGSVRVCLTTSLPRLTPARPHPLAPTCQSNPPLMQPLRLMNNKGHNLTIRDGKLFILTDREVVKIVADRRKIRDFRRVNEREGTADSGSVLKPDVTSEFVVQSRK